MRLLLHSLTLCTLVAVTVGLPQIVTSVEGSRSTSFVRQGPRRLARSDVVSFAASSDQAVTAQEKQLGESASSPSSSRKHKRCYYVGTFFHRIDCNAPANSTSIPYSHAPEATANAV